MPADRRRALAVVAHPDDLEYDCAAAIAGWTDGGPHPQATAPSWS